MQQSSIRVMFPGPRVFESGCRRRGGSGRRGDWEPAINLMGACMIWVAKAAGKVGCGFYHKAAIKIAGK